MRIALVHDWILGMSGAERVLKKLHQVFPSAPIYTLFYNPDFTREFMPDADIRPTFLQKFYKFFKSYQLLAPLMPIAIESLDLSEFDLVISSTVSFSKGLILRPTTKHISYCMSPIRQIWDWQAEYKKEKHKSPGFIVSLWQHILRIWDMSASSRPDQYIAISKIVQTRIQKYYRSPSTIIYPPVNIETKKISRDIKLVANNYFLIISRLFSNKNIDLAVKAFNKLGWPLVVIGEGPEFNYLKEISEPNVYMLGYQNDNMVAAYYSNCLAFLMPQEEDFGITPIEAFSYGKPVLALKRGGALEYIEEGINGEFFEDPIPEALTWGIKKMKDKLDQYNPQKIKQTAERFSEERFRNEIRTYVLGLSNSDSP